MVTQFLSRIRILPRLLGGFAVLAIIASTMFAAAVSTMSRLEDVTVAASRQQVASLEKLPDSAQSVAAARQAAETAHAIYSQGLWVLVPLLVGGVIFGTWINIAIALSISREAGRAATLGKAISQGELMTSIQPQGNDELAVMVGQLEAMRGALVTMVSTVRSCAESIDVASAEIDAGGHDLGDRAERVAAHLQRTVSELASLSESLQHTTRSALTARDLVGDTARSAEEGGNAVQRMVSTMSSIREHSTRIADIIGVIDGLSFQTNILALNAAVEAARAGEQGRGFAVVAGEVRALAQRSAGAAREIRELIQRSSEAVEAGTVVAGDAGQRMAQIVDAVQRVNTLVAEISGSAEHQGQSIHQLNHALGEVDQMAQGNAALVEQTAAAVQSLRGQASQLTEQVRRFQVDDVPAGRPRHAVLA